MIDVIERYKEISGKINEIRSNWDESQAFYERKRWFSEPIDEAIESDSPTKPIELEFMAHAGNTLLSDLYVVLADMLSYPPTPTIIPVDDSPQAIETAYQQQLLLNAILRETHFLNEIIRFLHNWLIYGTAGFFAGWVKDPRKAYNIKGQVVHDVKFQIRALSPYEFYVDPDVERWEDHQFVFVVRNVPTEVADKIYNLKESEMEDGEGYNTAQLIEYFDYERHVIFTDKGKIVSDEANVYGSLPVFWAPFIRRPGKAYGYSLVDRVRHFIAFNNIISTAIAHKALAGDLLIIPEGSIQEGEMKLGPGIHTIHARLLPGGQSPTVKAISTPDPNTIQFFQMGQATYNRMMNISHIDLGLAKASESGRAREVAKLASAENKAVYLVGLTEMYERMFSHILKEANTDRYRYFKRRRRLIAQLPDAGDNVVFNYDDIRKVDDVFVSVQMHTDISNPAAIGDVVFASSMKRLETNPNDLEARYAVKRILAQAGKQHLMYEDSADTSAINLCIADLSRMAEDFKSFPKVGDGKPLTPQQEKTIIEWHDRILTRWAPKPYHNHDLWIEKLKRLALSREVIEGWHPIAREVLDELINQHMAMRGGVWSQKGSAINRLLQQQMAEQWQPKKQQGGVQ